MPKPALTFFTELKPKPLVNLFNNPDVIDQLQTLRAAVSLGILDLSEERAGVVRKLNKAGIPVIAWLLLPEEEGYWFNSDNYEAAMTRYFAFREWTAEHDLKWSGVGLDIEMDINKMRQIMEEKQGGEFVSTLFKRFRDKRRVGDARQAYKLLVEQIHADGYLVESYHLPVIADERRADATVLQRTMGLVDVETDWEVLMLYSSFIRPNGAGTLWSYAPQADSVGVGNTGGGVEVEGVIDIPPLSWDEFSRDLRLCVMQDKPVHIFCLEGCVAQGFLEKLPNFDWDKTVPVPSDASKVRFMRTGLTTGLWLLQRPWVILLSIASLIGLAFLFKKSEDK
ncbi:MAG: hypothetical protein SVR81_04980 [Chloroflexota bacterium]|nr:hypothetical protein [Chloroflexota bacterium]